MSLRGLIAACALALPAYAAEPFDGQQVAALVEQALSKAGQQGHALVSPNRGFPSCPVTPVVTKGGRDWSTVKVTCPEGAMWSRSVRIKNAQRAPRAALVRRNAGIGDTIWALNESLAKGTVIAAHHLQAIPVSDASRLPNGVIDNATQLIGRTLKTNLGAGRAIQARHLEYDWFVLEGSRVVIEARVGAASIQTGGIALENGQLGERIRVENARSGKPVHVTVTGRNFVTAGANIP